MPGSARLPSLAGVTAALILGLGGAQPPRPGPAAAPAPATVAAPLAADGFQSARTYPAVAPPARLRIPALRVDSPLDVLDRRVDGTVAVPGRAGVAGWFRGGPRPGQPGPAVILGHVDSRTGPGVFVRLGTLRRGALVHVDRADGSTATFRVHTVTRVPKDRFPTDLVYAPTLDPALRLVTCGGSFDRSRGSYRDNVIAFADLV